MKALAVAGPGLLVYKMTLILFILLTIDLILWKKVLPRSLHLLNTHAHVHLDAHTFPVGGASVSLSRDKFSDVKTSRTALVENARRGFYRIREKQSRVRYDEPSVSPRCLIH